MTTRRGFITGLVSFVAAPAIVKVESLMKLPPKRILTTDELFGTAPFMVELRTSIPMEIWRAMNAADVINPLLDMPLIRR